MQKSIGQLFAEYKAAKAEFARKSVNKLPATWEEFVRQEDERGRAAIALRDAESKLALRWMDTFGSPF